MITTEIYILDSIEDGVALLENSNGPMLCINASLLPDKSKSGDCFNLINGEFVFNCDETVKRKEKIRLLIEDIMPKKD